MSIFQAKGMMMRWPLLRENPYQRAKRISAGEGTVGVIRFVFWKVLRMGNGRREIILTPALK